MDAIEAIMTRRSVGKVARERPPRELIERVLEAAVHAPNHHLTEPWRFFVLAGKAREELGQVMADVLRQTMDDPDGEAAQTQLAREAEKPLRAPVLIAVAARKSDNPKALPVEDVEATAAAVENLLLAASLMGLGAVWLGVQPNADRGDGIRARFGVPPEILPIAAIAVGHPAEAPAPRSRFRAGAVHLGRW
jgi:nitroreductase